MSHTEPPTAMTANLLVELLVEELPPKALEKLGASFASTLHGSLVEQGLCGETSTATGYCTPRRLAVHVTNVAARGPDRQVEQKLVPVAIGLGDDGKPTPVLLKKLAAIGADESVVAGLRQASDGKKDTLWLDTVEPGVALEPGLQKALEEAISRLPIPKVMTYQQQDGWTSVKFVRPAHGLVALHGAEVVAVSALGLTAGRATAGHRFEGTAGPIELAAADSYAAQLEEACVLASFAARRDEIRSQLDARAKEAGLQVIPDDALLDEVTALVELPNVLLCRFDEEFLQVPQECLVLTMKLNQKYFPLVDAQGLLSNRFLVVSNIRPADPSAVVNGNERVIRPRLADAKFFYDQDRKRTLESRLEGLAKVVNHNQLGSQAERMQRVRAIAEQIGQQLGGDTTAAAADRTALLAKADLLTEMVGEFPELQGTMGCYYARHDGEPDVVAEGIEDHYKPRYAGDELPRSECGIAVALADKLETLVGMFGIGQTPTGDKDPFALRRHALGVIRMLIERSLPLQLDELIAIAGRAFGDLIEDPTAALMDFVFDRLSGLLREQGYTAHEVAAVLSLRPMRLGEIQSRLAAVRAFGELAEAEALAAANKRIGNILRKSDGDHSGAIDPALLSEEAERALAHALQEVQGRIDPLFTAGDYQGALSACASLRNPVDTFFDSVMVNTDDEAVRNNRLRLLTSLHASMNRVADIAQLAK
jgi:glycyl-tRNA synthetase beta chain